MALGVGARDELVEGELALGLVEEAAEGGEEHLLDELAIVSAGLEKLADAVLGATTLVWRVRPLMT